MRIAVLADIRGNLPAIEAGLREAQAAGVDVANGDLAAGLDSPTPDAADSTALHTRP